MLLRGGAPRAVDGQGKLVQRIGIGPRGVQHDAADVVKQRLQLGHYEGLVDAVQQTTRSGGLASLYRSLPTTFLMNAPYASIMMMANESLRRCVPGEDLGIDAVLACGAISGAVDSAC